MIKIDKVSFKYGASERSAGIENIDLHIKKGQVVIFCGESGCGKTTITRLINGLIPHYYEGDLHGKIMVNGVNVIEESLQKLSMSVGSVFQNPRSQFFNVDTSDELAFGLENAGMQPELICKRINEIVKPFNLIDLLERNIFELSGGEKQRIACGSVAALLPEVIVLDEPSSNLDISSIKELRNIIEKWKAVGKTVIIAEHRLHYLLNIADRVIYMKNGKISRDMPISDYKKISTEELHEMGLRQSNGDDLNFDREYISTEMVNLTGFEKKYEDRKVLDLPEMNLPLGSVMAILGDNGAGKTTFVHQLCSLAKKSSGCMKTNRGKFCGKKRCKQFFMVMQDVNHQLFTDSVKEEIRLSELANDKCTCCDNLLKSLNLKDYENSHPMSLSGGQKQRVAIACAVASNRDFLVFDEPTSGLDYKNMIEVSRLISDLSQKGKTVFIVTHDPELISNTCNYICFLKAGRLEKFGEIKNEEKWLREYFKVSD